MGLCSLLVIYLGPNYSGGNEHNGDLLLRSVRPTLQRATADHSSAGDSWTLAGKSGSVSRRRGLGGGHCSFLLGPGAHKVLSVPSKSLFPQSCVILAALCGVNGNLLQEGLRCTQVCCTQSPCLCGSPLLPVPPQENYTLLYQQKSMSKMDKMHLHLS